MCLLKIASAWYQIPYLCGDVNLITWLNHDVSLLAWHGHFIFGVHQFEIKTSVSQKYREAETMCYVVWTCHTLYQQHSLTLTWYHTRDLQDLGLIQIQDTWFIHLLASCFHTWMWGIQRDGFSSIKDCKQARLVGVSRQRLLKGIPKTRDSVTVRLFIMPSLEKHPCMKRHLLMIKLSSQYFIFCLPLQRSGAIIKAVV